ncbi:hypothetical protein [Robiginitalea sp.]|jgi:hypothetical protein|uniref:hypothetical protein n=1 Tax=Robiginitalea sp. TaxID=1902411 RepID=UPI003C75F549
MEKQYCKVGSINPIGSGSQELQLLRNQLQHFNQKAVEAAQNNSALKDFFERKAQNIQKMLQQSL